MASSKVRLDSGLVDHYYPKLSMRVSLADWTTPILMNHKGIWVQALLFF